jgi:hypothetical protein
LTLNRLHSVISLKMILFMILFLPLILLLKFCFESKAEVR